MKNIKWSPATLRVWTWRVIILFSVTFWAGLIAALVTLTI